MNTKEQKLAEEHLIFMCMSGSHAYGMNTEHSDEDRRAVFIAPPEYVLGCMKNIEQVEVPGEDTVIYELAKFVKLTADCNPNLIELLFTGEENILYIHPAFEEIRKHRHLFLSKKAKFTFSGYAMSQMKRIRGHHRWIQNPQFEEPPKLLDFAQTIHATGQMGVGLDCYHDERIFLVKVNATTFRIYHSAKFDKAPVSEDGMNVQFVDIKEGELNSVILDATFLGTLIVQIDTFKAAHKKWKEYWKWKKNRNPVRAELEEKYGFDCKHASHLIRLLKMAHEILRDGEVIVRRPDAEELLAIRNGSFDYDELVKTAEEMDAELEDLYEKSSLPNSSDKEAINDLYIRVVQEYWGEKGLIKS